MGFWGNSLTKPSFVVTSAAIIWPGPIQQMFLGEISNHLPRWISTRLIRLAQTWWICWRCWCCRWCFVGVVWTFLDGVADDYGGWTIAQKLPKTYEVENTEKVGWVGVVILKWSLTRSQNWCVFLLFFLAESSRCACWILRLCLATPPVGFYRRWIFFWGSLKTGWFLMVLKKVPAMPSNPSNIVTRHIFHISKTTSSRWNVVGFGF